MSSAPPSLERLGQSLVDHPHRLLIERSLHSILEMARIADDTDDWQLISGALSDLHDALAAFHPHRSSRKVTVFGSARSLPHSSTYQLAEQVGREAMAAGFEVITGAGGGVMEAANRGAGADHSFGLNIQLPFEQASNPYVTAAGNRLVDFRYFFTRKLFFLRESDALVVLPGGFGTLDELFEALTLIQTGRTAPIPVVLLAPPGHELWQHWPQDLLHGLKREGLIGPDDGGLISRADSASEAIELIRHFYRVFHTTRVTDDGLELLLHVPLAEADLLSIRSGFPDLLSSGTFELGESCDDNDRLRPCLRFDFDQRCVGRLYQLIAAINALDLARCDDLLHPEQRTCLESLP
ncbi:TIGR00730 family Rossman fold protein [Synechococcus sp. RedBA-s]|uniref:LOG family protein n=1 Tax=Synechococcus sp. RedBA-s TaxID=2823741 RepID=UPI0020CBB6D1|nr:TIGR00730 family Rossman fold protein [Synechococcus sp. RedBA-s]MCP9799835.1 TIGR00730 family Rossman fold protein [Synechococcus sp. RedBA-s]